MITTFKEKHFSIDKESFIPTNHNLRALTRACFAYDWLGWFNWRYGRGASEASSGGSSGAEFQVRVRVSVRVGFVLRHAKNPCMKLSYTPKCLCFHKILFQYLNYKTANINVKNFKKSFHSIVRVYDDTSKTANMFGTFSPPYTLTSANSCTQWMQLSCLKQNWSRLFVCLFTRDLDGDIGWTTTYSSVCVEVWSFIVPKIY